MANRIGWIAFCTIGLLAVASWLLLRDNASRSPLRWSVSILLPIIVAVRGMRKKSLDFSGAMLAILVGFVLTASSACFCTSLLMFFITSSLLTKWKGEEKRKLDPEFREGGQRNWIQVLCNGGVASVASLLYLHWSGMGERSMVWTTLDLPSLSAGSCLASLACCCGDTWASEVGSVLGRSPRLITTGRLVPRGTNGAISAVGLVCSFLGGAIVGLSYYVTAILFLGTEVLYTQMPLVAVGGLCGLAGSLIDSLLGATLQYSGFSEELRQVVPWPGLKVKHISGYDVLSNHGVNLVSALLTALLYVAAAWCVASWHS